MKEIRGKYWEISYDGKIYEYKTQEDIANALGLSKSYINLLINGKRSLPEGMKITRKLKINEYLGWNFKIFCSFFIYYIIKILLLIMRKKRKNKERAIWKSYENMNSYEKSIVHNGCTVGAELIKITSIHG